MVLAEGVQRGGPTACLLPSTTLAAREFAVLESLVLRNELPVEAQGIYDQAVLMLARR
jgi:hypothetical protein